MKSMLQADKPLELLMNYCAQLDNTGYVRHSAVSRLLLYVFIIDFVNSLSEYMTDTDYKAIYKKLLDIFGVHCCILPYKPIIDERAVYFGKPVYTGAFSIKNTEADDERITEDSTYRAV